MRLLGLPRSRALAILGSAVAARPTASHAQPARIRLLTTPSDSGAEPYDAEALGFFKDAGLDVTVTTIRNGSAVAAAVASGGVDIGQGNLVPLIAAHERGLPFVLIAPAAQYAGGPPTSALIATAASPVNDARDLVGKTVGGSGLRDIGQVAFDMWAEKQGVDPSTIRYVEMPSAELAGALQRGNVAAAVVIEPFLSAALAEGARAIAPMHAAIAPRFLIAAFFTTRSWAGAHPDEVRRFAEAIARTARWANANRPRSAQILEQYTQVKVHPNQVRATYAERLEAAAIQPLIDASARDKIVTTPFPASALLP